MVKNLSEYRIWVKKRLVEEEISLRQLAKQMNIPHARISEALHGKPSGNKYIVPIIEELKGNIDEFEVFINGSKEENESGECTQ